MKPIYKMTRVFIHRHPVTASFINCLLIDVIIELLNHRSLLKAAAYLMTKPCLFLLNTIIIWASFSLLLLVRRKWFTAVFLTVFWIGIGIADFALRCMRVTPFNFADLRMISDALAVAKKYVSFFTVILAVIALALVLLGLFRLFKLLPVSGRSLHPVKGAFSVVVSLLAASGLCSLAVDAGLIDSQFGNLTDAYADYGLVYCFAMSAVNTGISKPKDYSEESIEEITKEDTVPESEVDTQTVKKTKSYQLFKEGIAATEETPNIIFLQLESFSDPTLYTHCSVSEDPIPYYHKLMKKYSSGYLSVPAVGAGTANTEFEVISGMNLDFFGPGEYPYKTVLQDEVCESICYDLKNIGYRTQAIHNNTGHFYDRYNVYSQLGFDIFTSLEYMDDYETTYMGWCKDNVLTGEITGALKATVGADVIYTVSVQGHGSYPAEKVLKDPEITVSGLESEEETNSYEYYISQIHEMDEFVKELTETLSKLDEPTILVMYGDHLPSLDLTADKLENGNEYQTQYVIWDNFGLEKSDKNLEAYQLSSWTLSKIGISTGTMICYHQAYLADKKHSKQEKADYQDKMEQLEYDLLYGDRNAYNGETPYEASDLRMGYKEIRINQINMIDQEMYITGENFTASSRVIINGKVLADETQVISKHLLYVENADLKDGENTVSVGQYAEANVVLSQTEEKTVTYKDE